MILLKKYSLYAVCILLVALLPHVTHSRFFTYVSILLFLNIIGAVSINLIMKTGQISIAHAAFMAIGAYTTAILTTRLHWPFVYCFIASGVMSALIALVIGRIFLRLRGDYFILGTFAFGEFMLQVIINNRSLLGGATGILGIPAPRMPFAQTPMSTQIDYYYLALAVMVMVVVLTFLVCKSPIGRIMDSINHAEELTQSLGVNVVYYKVLSFTLGCFCVGLSGCVYAYFMRNVSPYDFQFTVSTSFILMNVIGGQFSLVGPIIGAVLITPLPEFFRQFVQYQVFLYGLVIVIFVMYLPGGIVGIFSGKLLEGIKIPAFLVGRERVKREV